MKVCPSCGLRYPDENVRCFVDDVALEEMRDERIGALLKGRYQVESRLGEGGMATVYRARNTLVEREVAVKIMDSMLATDPSLKERFRREAKNAAAVAHPNIIDILDHGEAEDGTPFLVMELLEGEPLNDLIARGPVPPAEVARLGLQIARGLARAHDFDVLHRDLKPENIFLCRGAGERPPVAKLLDFGIARSMHDKRLTAAGQIFGTPQYMAPERVTSLDAGASADLYALGVILFELVTGRLPFESKDLPGFFIKHMKDPPPVPSQLVPSIPRRLEELILSLLAKKPEDRPVDAHAVARELTALAPDEAALPGPGDGPAVRAPSIAPTLPPTTLERWAGRAAVFEQMLQRAYPEGPAPAEVAGTLASIREILTRIHALRGEGLRSQRVLEQLEAQAKEGRERLGHAVHVLGEDLSKARAGARAAKAEIEPYLVAEAKAHGTYVGAHSKLFAAGGGSIQPEPKAELATAARETADALDRWDLARGAADKARRWLEAKDREVQDLEFQVSALRAQLERLEASYEEQRASAEESVAAHGEEAESLERRLTELGARFVQPLAGRRDLGDLFARLQTEGTPATGLRR